MIPASPLYTIHDKPPVYRIRKRANRHSPQEMAEHAMNCAQLWKATAYVVPTAGGLSVVKAPLPCKSFYRVTACGEVTFFEYNPAAVN